LLNKLEEFLMMKRFQNWPATAILSALVVTYPVAAPSVGTLYSQEAAASGSPQSTSELEHRAPSLANGVYAVLCEGPTRGEVETEGRRAVVLIYDRKYSDADKEQPPRYVALDRSSFVPLMLAGAPTAEKDDRGWTLLDVRLAPEHVKPLEDFTQRHLGGKTAIVIDGEIITMHKVRSVIKDGRARITRCSDDACKSLLLKLAR
jgi:preprotein translocase subunit SecD